MRALGAGYFGVELPDRKEGWRYGFRLDRGGVLPDPASRSQPEGVHGLSALVAPDRFRWRDAEWKGVPLDRLIFYELHVGAFTPRGTFAGVRDQLDRLQELGITAVELMPVAQFPGRRNWGYDGVFPFAVQHSYGGIRGLQALSEACHLRGLALFVDVVYNHAGPEGNYLPRYGPYFAKHYRTPWGDAVNFDGPESDEVRRFFIESAGWLTRAAHLDGLRVDAIHAIVDPTAVPFLSELTRAVHGARRAGATAPWVIAESALNDPRVVGPAARGGLGFDAMWNDDFHHALHVALTGERDGYFVDFRGVPDLRNVLVDGFSLAGRYSDHRRRRHGRPAGRLPAGRFVVFDQNHDQVGNRPGGERAASLLPFEALKLSAGAVLLAPYLPLVFMGSEFGERAPFLYFTDHGDARLAAAVRRGRRREFATVGTASTIPDPQAPATFRRSLLTTRGRWTRAQRTLWGFHRELFRLRARSVPVRRLRPDQVRAVGSTLIGVDRRTEPAARSFAAFHFGPGDAAISVPPARVGVTLRLDSSGVPWDGPGGLAPPSLPPGRTTEVTLRSWSFVFYAARSDGGTA